MQNIWQKVQILAHPIPNWQLMICVVAVCPCHVLKAVTAQWNAALFGAGVGLSAGVGIISHSNWHKNDAKIWESAHNWSWCQVTESVWLQRGFHKHVIWMMCCTCATFNVQTHPCCVCLWGSPALVDESLQRQDEQRPFKQVNTELKSTSNILFSVQFGCRLCKLSAKIILKKFFQDKQQTLQVNQIYHNKKLKDWISFHWKINRCS